MVRRVSPIAAVVLASLCGCGSGSSIPTPSAGLPCAPKPTGALCIHVLGDGSTVRDVIAYLSASESPLAGKTWRLVLERYRCDPGSGAVARCKPSAVYDGRTRRGPPPASTSCRRNGAVVTTPVGCHDTLAEEVASDGDWAGLRPLANGRPLRIAGRAWLCISEQIRSGGAWGDPGSRLSPSPPRTCATITPS